MLQAFVDCILDETTHADGISQYFVPGYPYQGVSSFGQIRVSMSITLETFFRLMVFPINLDDQLQRDTAKVCRIRRNWILTTKLLVSATSITEDLPHGLRKLVGPLPLVPGERYCIRVAPRSSC